MQSSILSIIFLSVFIGFTPVLFYAWLFFLRRKKKYQRGKQPTTLLILMFFGGVAAVALAFFTERWLIQFLPPDFSACVQNSPLCETTSAFTIMILAAATFLIVAPVEEGFKYLAVWGISFRNPRFTRIIDGAKFGVACALGFASAENALYLFSSLQVLDIDTFVSTFLLRFALSSPAHIFYSGIFGYYLGKAQFVKNGRYRLIATGLLLAILTHGLYDFVLFSKVGFYAVFVLAILFGALYFLFKSPENYAIRIPEFMRRHPRSRQKIYEIPVEDDLTPENEGVGKVLAEIPCEMRPITPKIKPEYLPSEVPSEFAEEKPCEIVKKKLKVPVSTVPTTRSFGGVTGARPATPSALERQQEILRQKRAASQKKAAQVNADQVVNTSIREGKRRRLQIIPPATSPGKI